MCCSIATWYMPHELTQSHYWFAKMQYVVHTICYEWFEICRCLRKFRIEFIPLPTPFHLAKDCSGEACSEKVVLVSIKLREKVPSFHQIRNNSLKIKLRLKYM